MSGKVKDRADKKAGNKADQKAEKKTEKRADGKSDKQASATAPQRLEPEKLRKALTACFFGWIVPGGGHWYLGRRRRASLFLAMVLLFLVLGVVMDGRIYSVEQDKPLTILATFASMGSGPLHFILKNSSWTAHGRGSNRSPYYEFGNTFILVAGLMNMLIILDAFDIGVGLKP